VVHAIEPGWAQSYCYFSYGAEAPGIFLAGDYRVEVLVWDEPLASGGFTIIGDRAAPV
jgi:hypothetical protein